MSPKRDILDYLIDMVDAIDAAHSFVVDMEIEQFRVDLRTVYATTHALEIVGEAAKRIPESVRVRYSAVPWRLMAGMRDRLIHIAWTNSNLPFLCKGLRAFGASGQELRPFLGHTGAVYAAAFSPNGTSLLTGANDQTAQVWNVQTGVEVRRLTTQATEVRDVSFSPDGRYILTAGGDATARLWHTDYHDTIAYLCGVLMHDLTPDELAQYGMGDYRPTCRNQFSLAERKTNNNRRESTAAHSRQSGRPRNSCK
jgi:uncharacterized protein with HEPN domain